MTATAAAADPSPLDSLNGSYCAAVFDGVVMTPLNNRIERRIELPERDALSFFGLGEGCGR